ncbi:MAG TPA: hypothetical protein VLF59_02520 [Candidatus Saccharimonadales bacterium]|nr:hypothetical protein [Candidatus Saccharimonadales bacterium]
MRLRTGAILTATVGIAIYGAYAVGSERNPAKPPSVSKGVVTTAWSGQGDNVSASFARVGCTSYTVTITNRSGDPRPWKLIINHKVFGSGTMEANSSAPKQNVPIKDDKDVQLVIEHGSGISTSTLYNQPVVGKRNC